MTGGVNGLRQELRNGVFAAEEDGAGVYGPDSQRGVVSWEWKGRGKRGERRGERGEEGYT